MSGASADLGHVAGLARPTGTGRAVSLAILLTAIASSAAAQSTRFEISGGYSGVNYEETPSFNAGWVTSATVYLTPWFGAVAEVSGQYRVVSLPDTPALTYGGQSFRLSFTNVAGGPRVTAAPARAVRAFGQALFGATRYGGDLASPIGTVFTYFLVQPGAGVDVAVRGPFAVRGEMDVPVVRNSIGRHIKGVRWAAQIVWRVR